MSDMTEVIVARIREARELRGKEQQWLANQVSLNRTDISRIENGKRHVKAVELSAITEALDLPIGWFLRNTPPVVASRRATLHSKGSTDFNVALEKIVFIVSRLVDIGVIRARRRTVYDFPRTHDDT
ncbi:helix-turn-helix domain-containing protein [Corynebacterium cystitidis]|nr:helix-turn-helix transcriptional regulator [Corynebacterium cystitidis]